MDTVKLLVENDLLKRETKYLKELALQLLEEYETSERYAIEEGSPNIDRDEKILDEEVKRYRRKIAKASKGIDADREGEDSVEIVRCKDCKYKEHCFSMVHMCEENQRFSVNRDIDFCSYGERKEKGKC